MEEIWKDIENYEGLYQVSSLGRVRSMDRVVADSRTGHRTLKGKIMSLPNNQRGYQIVRLSKDGKKTTYFVHRLVAQTFIPNPEEKPQIDHIDTNPANNRIDNLRWATPKENHMNPLTRKNKSDSMKGENAPWYGKLGKDNPKSKSIYQISKDGNLIRKWEGMREAERYTEATLQKISLCCQGKRRTSGGYRWIYASDLDAFLIEKMLKNIQKKRTAC